MEGGRRKSTRHVTAEEERSREERREVKQEVVEEVLGLTVAVQGLLGRGEGGRTEVRV